MLVLSIYKQGVTMSQVHPSARKSIDEKAEELRLLIKEIPKFEMPSSAKTEMVMKEIHEEDVIGDISESSVDYKGRTIGRYFQIDGKRVGLDGEAYQKVLSLTDRILRTHAWREKVGQSYVEQAILEWIKIRLIDSANISEFVNYFEEKIVRDLKKITVHVPLAQTVVEEPFEFCGAIIENLSKEYFDKIFRVPREHENAPEVIAYFEKTREEFQGLAAIRFDLECVPDFAFNTAIDRAKAITDLLSIYSSAIFSVDTKSVCKIRGTELIEQATIFLMDEHEGAKARSSVLDVASMKLKQLSKKEIARNKEFGMNILSEMVKAEALTEFERAILSMSYLYSKAAFTDNALEKLVYVLSALESTLLKSSSEPIQQNLAERLAICIKPDLERRKQVIKTLREVYSIRSNYLHHGNSSEERDQIKKFLMNAWEFFIVLISNSKTFKTRADFLTYLDDLKLSGGCGLARKQSYEWK